MIFLLYQYLNNLNSYQYECLLLSKSNIIRMLILNIMHIPSTFWQIKKQFLKFFKDFIIRINCRQEEEEKKNPGKNKEKNIFIQFKDDILDPKFITKQSDNNIEIFKEFSYLIIEFCIRYMKVAAKNYDKTVISAILQLLRHQISYPVEKIECAAEYFMRLTILSINREEQRDEISSREKTLFHNELVEAICDSSLERAEYLYSLSLKEEELGTFVDSEKENINSCEKESEEEKKDGMDIDFETEYKEPLFEMDYEFMSNTDLKKLEKEKDVFEKDDTFPPNLLSKNLRKRFFLRELNEACKRIVYTTLYFLRSNSYIYLFKKSLDVMKKLLKAFFILQNLCKKYHNIDLLMKKNNTLIILVMLMC